MVTLLETLLAFVTADTSPKNFLERDFNPGNPLLFDLYHQLRTKVHSWFVPLTREPWSYALVSSGRVRHPMDSQKLFVRENVHVRFQQTVSAAQALGASTDDCPIDSISQITCRFSKNSVLQPQTAHELSLKAGHSVHKFSCVWIYRYNHEVLAKSFNSWGFCSRTLWRLWWMHDLSLKDNTFDPDTEVPLVPNNVVDIVLQNLIVHFSDKTPASPPPFHRTSEVSRNDSKYYGSISMYVYIHISSHTPCPCIDRYVYW